MQRQSTAATKDLFWRATVGEFAELMENGRENHLCVKVT